MSNLLALPPAGRSGEFRLPHAGYAGGVAVLRGGLKNGKGTTFAPTLCRTASTVSSVSSAVPGEAYSERTLAIAIMRLSVGDQVVEVARPTCRRRPSTGTW